MIGRTSEQTAIYNNDIYSINMIFIEIFYNFISDVMLYMQEFSTKDEIKLIGSDRGPNATNCIVFFLNIKLS